MQLTPAFTNATGNAAAFSVSPDRQSIAYAADANMNNTFELFVVPAAGGTPVQVSGGFPVGTRINEIAWAPDSSQVAYVANPQGRAPRGFSHWEVFLVDRDGSNDRKINGSVGSPPVVSVSGIKWSPDSRYIAQVVLSLDPFQTIVGFNTFDTTAGAPNSTRISPTLDYLNGERINFRYEWSADSTRIAYLSSHEAAGTTQLYTAMADGSGSTRINAALVAAGDVYRFNWAPDGSRIAYQATQLSSARTDLFVSDFDGGNNQRINTGGTLQPNQTAELSWSPDSSRLAFRLDEDIDDVREVYVSSADGSSPVKVHPALAAGQAALNPIWSPDGQQLAYRSNADDVSTFELYISDVDGSGPVKVNGPLIQNGNVSGGVNWSPDGLRISYVADQGQFGTVELYVSTVDGLSNNRVNAPITAANVDISPSAITWADDSTRIVFVDRADDFPLPETLDIWAGTVDGSMPIMLNETNNFFGVFAY